MRYRLLVFTLISIGVAIPARADFIPQAPTHDLTEQCTNETGVTLGEVVHERVWSLIRHPLRPDVLSRVGEASHRAPKRGIQFELLTPGDVGATLHIRW